MSQIELYTPQIRFTYDIKIMCSPKYSNIAHVIEIEIHEEINCLIQMIQPDI